MHYEGIRHKRLQITGFHLHKIPTKGKIIELERSAIVWAGTAKELNTKGQKRNFLIIEILYCAMTAVQLNRFTETHCMHT